MVVDLSHFHVTPNFWVELRLSWGCDKIKKDELKIEDDPKKEGQRGGSYPAKPYSFLQVIFVTSCECANARFYILLV